MAYYLQMNGTSDYLQAPSLTINKIVMDFSHTNSDTQVHYYFDARLGSSNTYASRNGDGTDSFSGSTVKVNGVTVASGTVGGIPKDVRNTVEFSLTSTVTDDITFAARYSVQNFLKSNIYDIKLYNGTTLVAHYDMTLGNVNDQSGNGNNATLTGGTWVSDATGTTQTGASSVQGVSTITADATLIGAITGSASLQGVATLAATATVLNAPMLGSATLQGISTLTATGNKVQAGGASLTGVATSTAFAEGLTVLGAASLSGVGVLTASGISGASIARAISLFGSLPSPIALLGEFIAAIHLLGSFMDTIALQGSKPSIIALEGGLMATKTDQNFTMYAGDTPPFTFTMADSTSLSGATVKWVMRRGNVKGAQVLLKTTSSGLSVSGTVATITLLSADTVSLEGKFYHEAEVTDISGVVSTVMTGIITILPSGA